MKRIFALVLFVFFCVFAVPAMVIAPQKNAEAKPTQSEQKINVFFSDEGVTKEVNLEEYLIGVVCAEMPASFETEALKAQAVSARSYTIYKKNNQKTDIHPDADVCTDSTHCKAYISKEKAFSNWGENAEKNYQKISKAVYDTKGEIMTYQGEVAMAVFHSSSGGRTENSGDVWQQNLPYLVSVDSQGEEYAQNYYSELSLSFSDFCRKLSEEAGVIITSPDEISEPVLTEGSAVKSIIIGGKSFSGTEIRSMFGLRSAKFSIEKDLSSVTFSVRGYGHGVGMSQYGANAMAMHGKNYKEILSHYYTGVDFTSI